VSPPHIHRTEYSKINLGPEMALEMELEIGQAIDLSPCKRLRTFRLELRELYKCHPYVVQLLTSLETIPHIETITLVFYSSGRPLADCLRKFSGEWDSVDIQLCRLAELKNGGLRVSVGFNGFRTWLPPFGKSGTFMAKYRCSPYLFTMLCDSNIVTPQDIGLQ